MNYREYLDTGKWALTRAMCFERDGMRCRGCGRTNGLQAHHIVYSNMNADNIRAELDDLTTFCADCHKGVHESIAKGLPPPQFRQHQIPF